MELVEPLFRGESVGLERVPVVSSVENRQFASFRRLIDDRSRRRDRAVEERRVLFNAAHAYGRVDDNRGRNSAVPTRDSDRFSVFRIRVLSRLRERWTRRFARKKRARQKESEQNKERAAKA